MAIINKKVIADKNKRAWLLLKYRVLYTLELYRYIVILLHHLCVLLLVIHDNLYVFFEALLLERVVHFILDSLVSKQYELLFFLLMHVNIREREAYDDFEARVSFSQLYATVHRPFYVPCGAVLPIKHRDRVVNHKLPVFAELLRDVFEGHVELVLCRQAVLLHLRCYLLHGR